eukprot:TRINITY_DN8000_c0_g1_i1.p1 TRINITY_DN8000_c0_g1~~TRINITY_DN8000_c0_g1_i1.p1  ORF type:complete len:255 (+),score=45.47 TRINITY_DN8000_c0_g1_i1:1-765(+)
MDEGASASKEAPHAPSRNLGRRGILFTMVNIAWAMTVPIIQWKFGWSGVAASVGFSYALNYFDFITSDANLRNLEIFEANGYSRAYVFKVYMTNSLSFWIVPFSLIVWNSDHVVPYFSLVLVLKLAVALAVEDVLLFFCHRYMHRWAPEMHKFHHCVRYPTAASNLLFEPLDLAVEFTLPMMVVVVMHLVLFYDPWAFVVNNCIMNAWYGADHDEYLRLPHWYHHRYVDSKYFVYAPFGWHDKLDQMKKTMKWK